MAAALTFNDLLTEFLIRARLLRSEDEPVPADDPTRDPNYCWTHGQIYPACASQHEEQK
jgi:hypothetical protein